MPPKQRLTRFLTTPQQHLPPRVGRSDAVGCQNSIRLQITPFLGAHLSLRYPHAVKDEVARRHTRPSQNQTCTPIVATRRRAPATCTRRPRCRRGASNRANFNSGKRSAADVEPTLAACGGLENRYPSLGGSRVESLPLRLSRKAAYSSGLLDRAASTRASVDRDGPPRGGPSRSGTSRATRSARAS
jgi:hypothetical protein